MKYCTAWVTILQGSTYRSRSNLENFRGYRGCNFPINFVNFDLSSNFLPNSNILSFRTPPRKLGSVRTHPKAPNMQSFSYYVVTFSSRYRCCLSIHLHFLLQAPNSSINVIFSEDVIFSWRFQKCITWLRSVCVLRQEVVIVPNTYLLKAVESRSWTIVSLKLYFMIGLAICKLKNINKYASINIHLF